MSLESSFLERFTSEGRLKHQWQQALTEPNIDARLTKLRSILHQLATNQTKFAHLWLPFLDIFLAPRHLNSLTESDMRAIENMGEVIIQSPSKELSTEEIWRRAIYAYTQKGQEAQAYFLLTRLFHTPLVRQEWKDWAAWELAERGANDDEHLEIYMLYLQSASGQTCSVQMYNILSRVCRVNFDSALSQLHHAKNVSSHLAARSIKVHGRLNASAFYVLLVEKKPIQAAELFKQALAEDNDDGDALCGLLAAIIQGSLFKTLSDIVQLTEKITSPVANNLVTLINALQWLDDQYKSEPPPSTAQNIEYLKGLGLQKYVGDIIDVAIGKLYLLEGNAQRALEFLYPVVTKHPEKPQWKYYLSWANTLIDSKIGVMNCFTTDTNWLGNWTLATLAIDTDTAASEQYNALLYLKNVVDMKYIYSQYIEARLALVSMHRLKEAEWVVHDGSLEENMEALRIALGCAVSKKDSLLIAKLIDAPLFQHLPTPDRLLWSGLYEISMKNCVQGRVLLAEAYNKFGYRRAALVLTVHYLEYTMPQLAKYYLEKVGTGHGNSKIALLHAHIKEQEGNIDIALTTYKKLIAQGEMRAHYALGNHYLSRERYEDAIEAFAPILCKKNSYFPNDYAALALCSNFVIDPKPTDLWQKLEVLNPLQKQYWLLWNAFLAQLWYGNIFDAEALWDLIIPMLNHTGPDKDAIILEIARAIVHVCHKVENIEQGEKLISVLERIAFLTDAMSSKHTCQIGVTIITQKRYCNIDTKHHLLAQSHINALLNADPTNGPLTLFLASILLTHVSREDAIEILKNIRPLDEKEHMLSHLLIAIFDKQEFALKDELFSQQNSSVIMRTCYKLLSAINLFVTNHIIEGCQSLFSAFSEDAKTIVSIVNMKRAVPYLCIAASKERKSLPQIFEFIDNLVCDVQEGDEVFSLALCLIMLGVAERASQLLRCLKKEHTPAKKSLNQHVAQLLCHIAVCNYSDGNILKTIQTLRAATYWGSGTTEGKRCNQLANRLDLQYAAQNLLTVMFPGMSEISKVSGRYYYLMEVIEQNPRLKEALAKKQGDSSIRREWGSVVEQEQQLDVRLLHFRAIGYRDYVLSQNNLPHEVGDWIKCTVLWVLMLCSEVFWMYFLEEQSFVESEEREPLDDIEQDMLFYEVLDYILTLHKVRGSQAFLAKNYQEAKKHFHCLALCQRGKDKLLEALVEQKMNYHFPIDERRINWVEVRAGKMLKEWTDALIGEARKATEDLDVLRNSNLSRHYETGICMLESFVELDIPILRVLTTCLEWYNDWSNELARISKTTPQQLRTVMNSASKIANKLVLLSIEGEGYKKENQVLSNYFMRKGDIVRHEDTQECIALFHKSLDWNPENTTAHAWLRDVEEKELDEEDEDELPF